MIIPHEHGSTRSYRLSYRTIQLLVVLAVILAAGVVAYLMNQSRIVSLAMRASELERQNEELTRKNAKILELARKVDRFLPRYPRKDTLVKQQCSQYR